MQLPSSSHAPSAQPSLPSPTLTNPDMILPYDPPSPDSAPSTTERAQQDSSSSPSNGTSIQDTDVDGGDEMKGAMHRLFSNGGGRKLQKPNRIKAEQRNDQNEVTSAPGFPSSGTTVLGSSLTLHENKYAPTRTKTVTPSEDYWKGFDSAASGKECSPYEELADYEDVGPPKYSFPPLDNEKDGFSAPPDIEDDDVYSHAAMSIRAEQILANAKKRLTNMEGNLNRARSTLHNRPSSSMSSLSNRTPDPVSLYTIPQAKLSPSKHRQAKPASASANIKGHNRVFSETSVPSSLQTPAQSRDRETQAERSSSAMGSSSLNATGELNSDNSHNWFWTGLIRNTNYAHRHNNSLPALEEDGPAPESFQPSPTLEEPILEEEDEKDTEVEGKAEKEAKDRVESPSLEFGSFTAVGLTRARSTTQMRDLRDQMQDLKGKISSLKRRAREDSMTRRSMQSLRTPSPFTAAENWHGEASGIHQDSPSLETGSGSGNSETRDKHRSSESDKSSRPSKDRNSKDSEMIDESFDESDFDLTPRNNRSLQATFAKVEPSESTKQPLQQTSDGGSTSSLDDQANEASDNSSKDSDLTAEQDSLYGDDEEYHETSPSQTGERHEDRPDAFDYETFFLHSGTGTLARKGHSRANSSHSSIYSVETTKPTYTSNEDPRDFMNSSSSHSSPVHAPTKRATSRQQKERGHSRNDSRESISTVATFATATEGSSDAEDDDEWILQRPMAGAWTNDQSTKRKISPRNTSDLLPPIELARAGSGGSSSSSKRSIPTRKGVTTSANGIDPIPSVPPQFDAAVPMSPASASLAVLSRESAQLSNGDKKLVEMLVNSLTKVCVRLKDNGVANEMYDGRQWRRKLDQARRMLDDEMNGEVF